MRELREMSYDKLVEYSKEVFKEVRRRAYAQGYEQGKFDAVMEKAKEVTEAHKSPQQLRDEIVERAKADVESLNELKPRVKVGGLNGLGRIVPIDNYSIEFNVNKEKRTVAALVRGNVSERVRAKGIAKCAPSDCFNVHIGKAIALRRALGLDVPDEYLNAPQPTEVRAGDVVHAYEDDVFKFTHKAKADKSDLVYIQKAVDRNSGNHAVIVDDSREEE